MHPECSPEACRQNILCARNFLQLSAAKCPMCKGLVNPGFNEVINVIKPTFLAIMGPLNPTFEILGASLGICLLTKFSLDVFEKGKGISS